MIFILGSLSMGGIETFVVRMAKERSRQGRTTKILLLSREIKSNENLVCEARKYADVVFLDEIIKYDFLSHIPFHLLLLVPLNYKSLSALFENVKHVHVSSSFSGLFYLKIASFLKVKVPMTIGIYHSKEFIWMKNNGQIPYYEKVNRRVFSELLRGGGVSFFNDRLPAIYERFGYDCSQAAIFPLGVYDSCANYTHSSSHHVNENRLKIISIGRLVSFKTYNIWMIDVVNELKNNNIDVMYDIYGDGPLIEDIRARINKFGLAGNISLKGGLEYSKLAETVSCYDIFVGSGTAIIEASACGIPSIVGIESCDEPLSYGFCSKIPGFSYNEDGLYEKRDVYSIIMSYLEMNLDSKQKLRLEHEYWAKKFSTQLCSVNFDKMIENISPKKDDHISYSLFQSFLYSLSFFSFSVSLKLRGRTLSEYVYE